MEKLPDNTEIVYEKYNFENFNNLSTKNSIIYISEKKFEKISD